MTTSVVLVMALLATSQCKEAYNLEHGVKAPCSGILVPQDEALSCLRTIRVDLPTCLEDVSYCHKECGVKLDGLEEMRKIESRRADKLEGLWREATQPKAWYEHPAVPFTGGVLVTSLAVYAWSEARR